MNALYAAALEIQQFLTDRSWKFCIIGGLAVIRWGKPRATQDVDVSLFADFGSENEYIDPILNEFTPRIDDAKEFALRNRVLLVWAKNDVALDIALAGFPFEERVIDRASPFSYADDVELLTCSAEDLMVLKAFAGRDQDWFDVEGIAGRQVDNLDWNAVISEAETLSEIVEDSDMVQRLTAIRQAVSGG